MVQPRRSARQRARPTRTYVDDEDGEASDDGPALFQASSDDSEDNSDRSGVDEWRPPEKKAAKDGRGRRPARRAIESEESDDGDDQSEEGWDLEQEVTAQPGQKRKRKITSKLKTNKIRSATPSRAEAQTTLTIADPIAVEAAAEDAVAHKEAERLWQEVRSRPAAASSQASDATASQPTAAQSSSTFQNRSASGLDRWLGVKAPDWPSTCAEAMINDRDSLFVGFVYALSTPTQAAITQCLSHLTKVVQPQAVPIDRLPPAMQHLSAQRRGATHDMHAWRCLALKRGRNGLGGPEDYGLEEGQEDDGERFGAKEIAKAIRTYGATDVLVVVSRWYGGTMLGPARFTHILDCAKAALARHIVNEAVAEQREELKQLDAQIAELRAGKAKESMDPPSTTPVSATKLPSYDNLDPERADRLIVARKKQIELLKRPKKVLPAPDAQGATVDASLTAATEPAFEGDDAAALLALQEAEAAVTGQSESATGDLQLPSASEKEPGTVKAEPADPLQQLDVPTMPPSVVKEEPHEAITTHDDGAAEPDVKATIKPTESVVKEEEEEVDLTGWDEL